MTNQQLDNNMTIIKDNIRRALRYLEKARVFDSCGQHDQSKEYVSLAISKLSFLVDLIDHLASRLKHLEEK